MTNELLRQQLTEVKEQLEKEKQVGIAAHRDKVYLFTLLGNRQSIFNWVIIIIITLLGNSFQCVMISTMKLVNVNTIQAIMVVSYRIAENFSFILNEVSSFRDVNYRS